MNVKYILRNIKTGDELKINNFSLKFERYGGILKLQVDSDILEKVKLKIEKIYSKKVILKTEVLFDAELIAYPYNLVLFNFEYCVASIDNDIIVIEFEGSTSYYDNCNFVAENSNDNEKHI